jgi:hypothetical protein
VLTSNRAAKKVTVHLTFESEIMVVPVESRLRPGQRDSYGLYPHELLMLYYARGFTADQSDYQGFWWYQYGVRQPEKVLANLAEREFVTLGGVREAMEARTLTNLKKVLATHGLKQSGRKSEIIDRLCEGLPMDDLLTLFPERFFAATSAGSTALGDSEYVFYIHRSHRFGLDIFSLADIIGENPGRDYRELLLEYGVESAGQCASENNWGLYRNVKFDGAEILAELGKLRDAIVAMAEVVYWDLSGLGNNFDMKLLGIMAPYFFPYAESLARTAPAVVDLIFNWAKQSGLPDPELRILIQDHLSTLSSPINLFTPAECAEIAFLERDVDLPKLTSIYGIAQKRFISNYPHL